MKSELAEAASTAQVDGLCSCCGVNRLFQLWIGGEWTDSPEANPERICKGCLFDPACKQHHG